MNIMVAIEVKLPERLYRALKKAARQQSTSEAELATVAIQAYLEVGTEKDVLLGLFTGEDNLLDEVVDQAMYNRESTPFRMNEALLG